MFSAGVRNLEDLTDLFIKHKHTGNDFSQSLLQDFFITHTLFGTQAATAGNYGPFFIAPYPCQVMSVQEVHTTAGTDGSDVTLQVERLQGTEASGAGDDLLGTALNLKGTADTVQTGDLTAAKTNRQLVEGNRLGLVLSGTPTSVNNVVVTVWLKKL